MEARDCHQLHLQNQQTRGSYILKEKKRLGPEAPASPRRGWRGSAPGSGATRAPASPRRDSKPGRLPGSGGLSESRIRIVLGACLRDSGDGPVCLVKPGVRPWPPGGAGPCAGTQASASRGSGGPSGAGPESEGQACAPGASRQALAQHALARLVPTPQPGAGAGPLDPPGGPPSCSVLLGPQGGVPRILCSFTFS